MKNLTRAAVAVVAAGALALGATPAYAAAYSGDDITMGDAGNTYWQWDDWQDFNMTGVFDDDWIAYVNDSSRGDTFYGTDFAINDGDGNLNRLTCDDPGDLTTDASGDKVLLCIPQNIDSANGSYAVQVEMRFYADLQTWRTRVIITNDSSEPVTDQVFYANYGAGQDSGTALYASTTSDPYYPGTNTPVTTADDLVFQTDDRTENANSPVVKYAVGRAGAQSLLLNEGYFVSGGMGGDVGSYLGNADSNSYFAVPTLAPGDSVEFVTMAQVWFPQEPTNSSSIGPSSLSGWSDAVLAADQAAWADTSITSDAYVFAGIGDTSKVLNWSPAATPTPPTPSLPDTGVDASLIGGIAVLLLGAGATVFLLRRRAKA